MADLYSGVPSLAPHISDEAEHWFIHLELEDIDTILKGMEEMCG
jgi:hypothetical protein